MPQYRLFYSGELSAAVNVEAEDLDAALELGHDEIPAIPYIPGVNPPDDWVPSADHYVDGEYQEGPKSIPSPFPPADPSWDPAAAQWFRTLVESRPPEAFTISEVWTAGAVAADMTELCEQQNAEEVPDAALVASVRERMAALGVPAVGVPAGE